MLGLCSACTLERRPDAEAVAEPDEAEVEVPPSLDPAEAARVTVEVFRESVRVGDISLALALLEGDAVLLDELAGPEDAAPTRGELLLDLRRRHAEGLRLEVEASEVRLGPEVALVISRLGIFREQPAQGDDGRTREGEARETVVLVSSPDGWRILHLHRSVVAGP